MKRSKDLFWGLLLIVIGIVFGMRYILNIDIPVGRIVGGFVLIYIGVSVIFRGSHHVSTGSSTGASDIVFKNDNVKANGEKNEYNIIFGSGVIDLTDIQVGDNNKKVDAGIIFSSGVLKVRADAAVVIKVDSAFGSAHLPNGTVITFGEYTYRTRGYREREPYALIKADVVFGRLDIEEI